MEDVPLEVGKSYDTKNRQGFFLVNKINLDKRGNQMQCWGIYLNTPDLGVCPIGADRLIGEKKIIGEKEACDCCLLPLDEKYSGKKFVDF